MLDATHDPNITFAKDGHLNKSYPKSYVEVGYSFANVGTNGEIGSIEGHSSTTHDLVDARVNLDKKDDNCAYLLL